MKLNAEIDANVIQALIDLLKTPHVTVLLLVLGIGLLLLIFRLATTNTNAD